MTPTTAIRRAWETYVASRQTEKMKDVRAIPNWLLRWVPLAAWVGIMAGLASAIFLGSLDWATDTRGDFPALLYGLPLIGVAIGIVYERYGKQSSRGTNLVLDRIHEPEGERLPLRMAPLVLVATVLTHLFGGSAGREGTAVQMGGTLADLAAKPFQLSAANRRILILTGVAAGFGSVFGTPIAGFIFGVEVSTVGKPRWDALLPCIVASYVGDFTCRFLGIEHHTYNAARIVHWSLPLILWIVLAGLAFAGAALAFIHLTHAVGKLGQAMKGATWIRPVVGGLVVIAMTLAVGTQTYNGLGIPLISAAFHHGEGGYLAVPLYAFALKIVVTAVTLGTGFKGGEVTPLFCIGATLGNAIAILTHQDPALFAALGFVAVFAAAANTPLACIAMGIELFGPQLAIPLTIACLVAFAVSGRPSIYSAQKREVWRKPNLTRRASRLTLEK